MANNLTSRIKEIDKRVEALETQDLSGAESLAKITSNLFDNVNVSVNVTVSKHYNKMPGTFHAGVFRV